MAEASTFGTSQRLTVFASLRFMTLVREWVGFTADIELKVCSGVIASLGRLGYQVHEAKRPNKTKIVMILLMLNIVEQMVGIIVACMPVFPSLFRSISEKRSGSGPGTPATRNQVNSFFARRREQKASPDLSDSGLYSVHGSYEELEDLEGQRRTGSLAPSANPKAVMITNSQDFKSF
ncbi:MAG: hypothetical protein Q9213_002789 [Squamulea squamosa]